MRYGTLHPCMGCKHTVLTARLAGTLALTAVTLVIHGRRRVGLPKCLYARVREGERTREPFP